MSSVELVSSITLNSATIAAINTCSEVMIPAIFSTKKSPVSSGDLEFIDTSAHNVPELIDVVDENATPWIALTITVPFSRRLDKYRKVRSREMVAALQKALQNEEQEFEIVVALNLTFQATVQSSNSNKIPDLAIENPELNDVLDTMTRLIGTNDATPPNESEAEAFSDENGAKEPVAVS